MSEAGVEARIEAMLTELRMPSIRSSFRKLAKEISRAGGDYSTFLHALLEEEVCDRRARRIERRMKEARFPQVKQLQELDAKALPAGVSLQALQDLATGAYLEDATNIVAVGNSGTGKTHVSIALGVEACRQCRRVRFFTATDLVCELEEAHEQHGLHRYLRRFAALDLVVIDELGYMPVTQAGAQLLFQALSARHERGSVVVNSNLAFGEWSQIFQSERLTVALLDRLTHRCHILEMNGDSYRLSSARRRKTKAVTAAP
jgi:DNA replication protein DnaC